MSYKRDIDNFLKITFNFFVHSNLTDYSNVHFLIFSKCRKWIKLLLLVVHVFLVQDQKQNLNWEKWYICQDDKPEKLTCPVLFEESSVGKTCGYNALEEYQKVEQMINKLDSTGKTNPGLDNFSLDDGNRIAHTILQKGKSPQILLPKDNPDVNCSSRSLCWP